MPVSPVDPSLSSQPCRFLEHLHALELSYSDGADASDAFAQFSQLQARQAALTLSSLSAEHPQDPTVQDRQEAERLRAAVAHQQEVFETLSAPYDTLLGEMAGQGRRALLSGIRLQGREQREELKDALKLLQGVLNHPIGSRNYAVWYEVAWLQWKLGEPLEQAIESYYHTIRLSRSTDSSYHLGALRHQAFLLAQQGNAEEAAQAGQTALALSNQNNPMLWVEVARYLLKIGDAQQAQELLNRALHHDLTSAFAIYSEPELAPLYEPCQKTLDSFADAARNLTQQQLNRLLEVRRLEGLLHESLGITLTLPPPIALPDDLSQCGIFQSYSLGQRASREAEEIIAIATEQVQKEHEHAETNARRLKIQIDQALSEKTYYEGSLKNIEEHARESGFSLHPYSFNNPFFRKRNQKAEDARFAYESFRQKLAQCETFLKEHLPGMEAAFEKHESRRLRIEEILAQLSVQRSA